MTQHMSSCLGNRQIEHTGGETRYGLFVYALGMSLKLTTSGGKKNKNKNTAKILLIFDRKASKQTKSIYASKSTIHLSRKFSMEKSNRPAIPH